MRFYSDTSSQQARQFDANTALDAATAAARRAASTVRIRAAHQARQKCRAERAALEAAYDLGSVQTGTDYERFVANILTASNIPVVRVGQSGDHGADLLANTATGTAVIQCKFYTHPVISPERSESRSDALAGVLRCRKRGLHRQGHLPRHRRLRRLQCRVHNPSPPRRSPARRDAGQPRRNRVPD